MTIEPFWVEVEEPTLRQGDYLPGCFVPVFDPNFTENSEIQEVQVNEFDLIIVTQSCDLENKKARLVAMVPIYPISEFEKINPEFAKKGRWNDVLKGRVEGLHLLASPTEPADNQKALVVDFREIYSLPYNYLVKHATELGSHWRLKSPYLEHFSQTFARFFMRVGLPSSIPPFK
jgi:hypothetical protein